MFRGVLAGTTVGFLVAGFMLLRKMGEIQRQGSAIEAGLMSLGENYAREVARRAADAHMATYGITAQNIAGAQQLKTTLDPFLSSLHALFPGGRS